MELNNRDKVARLTIVYYGPAAGGKTSNLQLLHKAARREHRGDLISLNSLQGRTVLFDLLPLHGLGLSGWEIKFSVLAVPGQAGFTAARRRALRGADGVVFVANSAEDRWYDNEPCLREMNDHMLQNALDPRTIPLTFQYNKRDLPAVMPVEAMDRALNARRVPSITAVAPQGEGVLETLAAITEMVVNNISARHRDLSVPPGVSAAQWTREGFLKVFGSTSLSGESQEREVDASAGRRVVRVGLAEAGGGSRLEDGPARSDSDASSRLLDPYVQASVTLSHDLEAVREQRDQALRFLEDLQHTLATVEAQATGQDLAVGLRRLLTRMVGSARSRRASLLTPGPGGTLRMAATYSGQPDVLASRPGGAQLVSRHLLRPALVVAGDAKAPAELTEALADSPGVHAVASVPLRSATTVHGVVLLYYGPTDPLPSDRELVHLDWMGRGLGSSIRSRRVQAPPREDPSLARRAAAAEAALRVLGQSEAPLGETGGDGPARAARAARLLERGELPARAEPLGEVLRSLSAAGLVVRGDPSLVVRGDSRLLQMAVEALAEIVTVNQAGPPRILARRNLDGVEIVILASLAFPLPGGSDGRWLLARRVAELHSGELSAGVPPAAPAFTLRLPPG